MQDQLAARDIQLQMWRQKAAGLEDQLAAARKNEADAIERQSLAETRARKAAKDETESASLKQKIIALQAELKDLTDIQAI